MRPDDGVRRRPLTNEQVRGLEEWAKRKYVIESGLGGDGDLTAPYLLIKLLVDEWRALKAQTNRDEPQWVRDVDAYYRRPIEDDEGDA